MDESTNRIESAHNGSTQRGKDCPEKSRVKRSAFSVVTVRDAVLCAVVIAAPEAGLPVAAWR